MGSKFNVTGAPTHLPFLLAQNLSSKQIVPTDNMWPKSDNAKKCHWWLKGWYTNKLDTGTTNCANKHILRQLM